MLYPRVGGYKYEYQLQDHLGNNRVRFRIKPDGTADLTQVQNYYPFGGDMGDTTMNFTVTPNNLYKYSGKELQTELDLNTYDFGARHYNPQLGRWMTMDPLAETSEELSPYNYVNNNPFNFIDPDGMQYTEGGLPIPYAPTSSHIPAGGGGGSGGLGWGTFGLNAGIQAYNALKAFSWKTPTHPNFSGFKNVQGNSIYVNAGQKLGVDPNAIKSVVMVESSGGSGFYKDGSPVLRFEGHILIRSGSDVDDLISQGNDDIIYPFSEMTKHAHGRIAYKKASDLNAHLAKMSTSYGRFQIMGNNYSSAGFPSVEDFVNSQSTSQGQVQSFINFINSNHNLINSLKNKDFSGFAEHYNGKSYKLNNYDIKMKTYYDRFSKSH